MIYYSNVKEVPEIRIGVPYNFWSFIYNESGYKSHINLNYIVINYLIFWIIYALFLTIRIKVNKQNNQNPTHP